MESNFEMGDEYNTDDEFVLTEDDCSPEFEQGLDDYGQSKVFSHFLDKLLR